MKHLKFALRIFATHYAYGLFPSYICVSWTSTKTDLYTNLLNLIGLRNTH